MELTFTQTNKKSWVAEFEASSDFNIHIERKDGVGRIRMQQRTSSKGDLAEVEDFTAKNPDGEQVIDYDCPALIWPKTIRIVSEVEPTYAEVTSNGTITIHEVGVISFTIDGESFKAKEGMTWAEFCKSEYANADFYFHTDYYEIRYQGALIINTTSQGKREEPDDVIMANGAYILFKEE